MLDRRKGKPLLNKPISKALSAQEGGRVCETGLAPIPTRIYDVVPWIIRLAIGILLNMNDSQQGHNATFRHSAIITSDKSAVRLRLGEETGGRTRKKDQSSEVFFQLAIG
jgi:hypothetical protein